MPQDTSNSQTVFVAVAALSTRGDAAEHGPRGHPINNRTVIFVVSCYVSVSKQVEVSTTSVESTGPWLVPLSGSECVFSRSTKIRYINTLSVVFKMEKTKIYYKHVHDTTDLKI